MCTWCKQDNVFICVYIEPYVHAVVVLVGLGYTTPWAQHITSVACFTCTCKSKQKQSISKCINYRILAQITLLNVLHGLWDSRLHNQALRRYYLVLLPSKLNINKLLKIVSVPIHGERNYLLNHYIVLQLLTFSFTALFIFNEPYTASFSFIFILFQTNITIFTTNKCDKMSIQYMVLGF